jgi:hypothetical protein
MRGINHMVADLEFIRFFRHTRMILPA